MTNPKPARNAMLMGRNKFGARFARIRLKRAVDMVRKSNCQRHEFIFQANLFVIMYG
jgi:hypothetical protein